MVPVSRAQVAGRISRVLWITLALNLAVAGGKIAYGHATGVLSIRADGFHSLTDSINNLVGLLGVSFAALPADAAYVAIHTGSAHADNLLRLPGVGPR